MLRFRRKESYGRVLYYPTSPQAVAMLRMFGRKTVSRQEMEQLRASGFTVGLDCDCDCILDPEPCEECKIAFTVENTSVI